MDNIPQLNFLKNKFDQKFRNFDYEFYHDVISERTINSSGIVSGSCLIKEVAILSAFFMDKQTRRQLDITDAAFAALEGWNLSGNYIDQEQSEILIHKQLGKRSRALFKNFKKIGIKVSLSNTAWLVYCCAMLREQLYAEFSHDMKICTIEDTPEGPRIQVVFSI